MTTNSDAYFANKLLQTLTERHPEFPIESVKGKRVGVGSVRVIHVLHSGGKFAQFPFPRKGLHAGETHNELYRSACSMLRIEPVKGERDLDLEP